MRTQDFMELVMPRGGFRVLALEVEKADGSGTWLKFRKYDTAEEAAQAAVRFDDNGKTVFFGVNSFNDWYYDEKKEKRRIRTQENLHSCRSLYDDFDVDPDEEGKYDTREKALADIIRFAKAVRLTPTVTSSGGGYHVYLTLDEDVSPDVWEDLSAMKRDITHHLRLKVDRAVDMDSCRVLRPVGLHNRKTGEPRPVELVKEGKAYSVEKVRSALSDYIRENNVAPAPAAKKRGPATNAFGAALEDDYPPSDADLVADRCAAVRAFRDTGGDIPEPHWHRAIGVVKFCEDGEEHIHQWSSGYDGYTQSETQAKIDEWDVGPTTCAQMDQHVGCMANCPFKDKINSPITLGFSDEAPSKEEESDPETPPDEDDEDEVMVIEGQPIPYWPKAGYRWNGSQLSKARQDPDGLTHWVPFCRSFAYPVNRVRDSDGEWQVHWRAREKNGDWREFFMPTNHLASTDQMHKTFATHEVFLTRTKNARNDMAEFAEDLIEKLQAWRMETKTYNQFGWAENYTKFIMGTTAITAKGEEQVLCDPAMPPDVADDFGTSGTVEDWVLNIDTLYNRPDAEPFQFALCHSMGSILVELFGSTNWHGLPLAFTGEGGTGKSTATKIACGFFGHPKFMERQTGEQGSTLNAAIKRIALMGSVPVLLDEFSGRTPEELTRTGYALANGRDKERLGPSGRYATVGGQWFKNSFITSNDSIIESISRLPAGYKVEATQLRFFEVSLPKDYRHRVFPDISQTFIEHHMDNVYGAACRPYIRFIIKHKDWVRRQIVAAREKFNPKSEDDNKERFYRDTIVTALVAGKIAEKLGLISFDLSAMKKWATDHVKSMRGSRRDLNVDSAEHLARFFGTLQGRLIVTANLGKPKTRQVPLEVLRGEPVGRVCVEDEKFFVMASALSDFSRDRGIPPSQLRDELEKNGYIVPYAGELQRRMNIASGTTIAGSQARCYELDYSKVFDGTNLKVVQAPSGAQVKSGS